MFRNCLWPHPLYLIRQHPFCMSFPLCWKFLDETLIYDIIINKWQKFWKKPNLSFKQGVWCVGLQLSVLFVSEKAFTRWFIFLVSITLFLEKWSIPVNAMALCTFYTKPRKRQRRGCSIQAIFTTTVGTSSYYSPVISSLSSKLYTPASSLTHKSAISNYNKFTAIILAYLICLQLLSKCHSERGAGTQYWCWFDAFKCCIMLPAGSTLINNSLTLVRWILYPRDCRWHSICLYKLRIVPW